MAPPNDAGARAQAAWKEFEMGDQVRASQALEGDEVSMSTESEPKPDQEMRTDPAAGRERMELYLILYAKELEDEVIQLLETAEVPGYTEFPKLIGRGRRIAHFDNPVWPGATGAVFTVIHPEQAPGLEQRFQAYSEEVEVRTHGLFGLHMFALPCQQII